jgi:hypothetical protein
MAMRLLHVDILQELEAGRAVVITQTRIRRALDIVGCEPGTAKTTPEPRLDALARELWFDKLPVDHVPPNVSLAGSTARSHVAQQLLTNAGTHVAVNFERRHLMHVKSWVGRWYDDLPGDDRAPTKAERTRDRRRAIRTVECASLTCDPTKTDFTTATRQKFAQFHGSDTRTALPESSSGTKRPRVTGPVDPTEAANKRQCATRRRFAKADAARATKGQPALSAGAVAARLAKATAEHLVAAAKAATKAVAREVAATAAREAAATAGALGPTTAWLTRHEAALVEWARRIRGQLNVAVHIQKTIGQRFCEYLPYLYIVQKRQAWEQALSAPVASSAPPVASSAPPVASSAPVLPTRGFRAMALLPLPGFGGVNLTVDTEILTALHRRLCATPGAGGAEDLERAYVAARRAAVSTDAKAAVKEQYKEALWGRYFRLDAVPHAPKAPWVVRRRVLTDGIGCTVDFRRPLRADEAAKVRDRDAALFGWRVVPAEATVVAVDPGRRDLFTATRVVLDDAAAGGVATTRGKPGDAEGGGARARSDVAGAVHCSQGEYRQLAGFTTAERRHLRLLRAHPAVQRFQDAISEPARRKKTGDAAVAAAHLSACATPDGLAAARLYGDRRARCEAFERHRTTQQTRDALCRRLLSCAPARPKAAYGEAQPLFRSDVVVAFGDAGFNHASKGHGAGPTKALKRNLARHCAVVDTSEFRSSKLCSKCFTPLADRSADGAVLGWGVRRCQNTECSTTWWHRDVNAARNIGRAFLYGQAQRKLPPAFLRTAGADAEDEEAVAAPDSPQQENESVAPRPPLAPHAAVAADPASIGS